MGGVIAEDAGPVYLGDSSDQLDMGGAHFSFIPDGDFTLHIGGAAGEVQTGASSRP